MNSKTTNPSNQTTKDLLDRLILFEKLIELKSNECAYYRTKIHLMQMNTSKEIQHSSSSSNEDISSCRNNSPRKSILKKTISNSSIYFKQSRKSHIETNAQNQNFHLNQFEEKFLSQIYHIVQDKNIQCNENDFDLMKTSSTILKIRLPHRFIKSLVNRSKKNSSLPRLKVHLTSQLLNKLFQSIHSNSSINQFIIQSQFGKFLACIDQKQQRKLIHAKAKMKIHSNHRLSPIIRHITQTKNDDDFDHRKILIENNHHSKIRQRKRHLLKLSSSSNEQSIRSSMTNHSRTTETVSSTDQTNNSINIDNMKHKNRKINIKR